jgi:hypothetical protein
MDQGNRFSEMKRDGRLRYAARERAWIAQPDEVVDALAQQGYSEYKREVARNGRNANGGMWQGIDARTGSVASAIWVNRPTDTGVLVFIDIDGQPFTEP